MRRFHALALTLSLLAAAAIVAGPVSASASAPRSSGNTTITLMSHDSFAASKKVMREFTKKTGVTVKVLPSGDAGAAVNQAILTKSNPLGDVFFGIDNTLLSRGLDAGIFVPYKSPELANISKDIQLDPRHRVTPVDTGDVCVNFDRKYFADKNLTVPQTLDDLAKPEYKGLLVVENPATSSPGLAFLLATVSKFGPDGWRSYWDKLRDNGVKVVDGWEQAYNTEFSGSAGKGDYPLVVSYATSPPAEVVNANPQPDQPPTGALLDTCFRQIEFVGIMKGTTHEKAAKQLVDFMLSDRFQQDMPLQMYVFPARDGTKLPSVFVKYAKVAPSPFSLPPEEIAKNRDQWIDQWTSTVLR
ncbi:MAG TPA: thiamine ABC transporter substrate-binding protein [Acidimicrobiia bacterium]|nr:thiamine ABC transporter substrate-binding protein [Acidimicrobiia bacterium]